MAFAFSKTTPATGAAAMFDFKEVLVNSSFWTVLESSDGTTYNNAGDQITSGGSGANGMENDYAWFRIADPAAGNEFIVQRQASGNTQWRIKHSMSAGFTGGTPGATQVPSATDEQIIFGGGTDASPTFAALFATDGTYRWNVATESASNYEFWAGAFPTGGGNPTTAFVFDLLTAYEATDGYFMAIYISGSSPFQDSQISSESFSATTNALWATVPSASPTTYDFYTGWVLYSLGGTANAAPNGLPTNPINGNDEVFPIVLGRRSALSNPGHKGVSSLMKWTGKARDTGDTLSVSTTSDRIVYRDVTLPWDGTTPLV